MSDYTKLLTFRSTAPSLSHVIAELTAALMTMESGETVHIILPSLQDKQFQKWGYAVRALCKQWDALIADGNVMLYLTKQADGRRECLYKVEFDLQK